MLYIFAEIAFIKFNDPKRLRNTHLEVSSLPPSQHQQHSTYIGAPCLITF